MITRTERDLANAIRVLLYTPDSRRWLAVNDPQALKQAHQALVAHELASHAAADELGVYSRSLDIKRCGRCEHTQEAHRDTIAACSVHHCDCTDYLERTR